MTWEEFKAFIDYKLQEHHLPKTIDVYLINTGAYPDVDDLDYRITRDGLEVY